MVPVTGSPVKPFRDRSAARHNEKKIAMRQPAEHTTEAPLTARFAASQRWLSIILRTGHIGVAAVLFGGTLLLVPPGRLHYWHHATIASGLTLLLLEWLHDRHWPHRGKGLLALFHAGLGLLIHLMPDLTVPLLWLILISGSLGSHMPRRYRHWSIVAGWEQRSPESRNRRSP